MRDLTPLKKKMSEDILAHLDAHLPSEFKTHLDNSQLLKELLYCLSGFVLSEKRRAVIEFTNRVVNARNRDEHPLKKSEKNKFDRYIEEGDELLRQLDEANKTG